MIFSQNKKTLGLVEKKFQNLEVEEKENCFFIIIIIIILH